MSRLPREGAWVRLREHTGADLEAMHAWRGDPETMRFLTWGSRSLDETRAALDHAIAEQRRADRRDWFLAVELRATGETIGDVGLTLGDGDASLGWFFRRQHQGRGYATEAARLLVAVAFDELRIARLVASCDTRNRASEGVMRRLGMRRIGTAPRASGGIRVSYELERVRR